MDCLKSHIKLSIALISDEDPNNDWRLAMGFMFSGDDVNALAAWYLIGPTTNLPITGSPKNVELDSSNEPSPGLIHRDTMSNEGSIDDHKLFSGKWTTLPH